MLVPRSPQQSPVPPSPYHPLLPPHLSGTLAPLPLWLLATLLAAGYLIALFWFPLVPHATSVPPLDVRSFSPSLAGGLAYLLLLGVWFSLTGLAYRRVRSSASPPSVARLLLVAALFGLILIPTYPINAIDIFGYFTSARVAVVYGQSPLAVPITAFAGDPFIPLAGQWAGATSPYGPAWLLIAAALTALAPNNILAGLVAFKLLGLAAHLGCGWLIWRLLAGLSPAEQAARTLLWAWNPALLLMFVVDGHNDAVMLFWLLLGLWLMRRGQMVMGMVIMALAALTKLIGLLPLPLFFLWAWRMEGEGRGRRLRFALLSALGIVALAVLTFLPFGSPLPLAGRLADEAAGGGAFSPLVFLILLARQANLALSVAMLTRVALALFVLLALWLAWQVWRGRSPIRATAAIFAAYLLTALNFRIWYSAWLFPWLLLVANHRDTENTDEQEIAPSPSHPLTLSPPHLLGGLTFLATAQASVVIYGHLRVFVLGGDQVLAHLIGVPFTFGLPLLVTYLAARR